MKTVFTLLTFFIVNFSFGQTSFRSALQSNNPNDQFGFDDLVQMDDGSYVCAGWSYMEDDNGMLIAKFNSQGQLITSKNVVTGFIDGDQDENGISVIKTSDGGVAVRVNLQDEGRIGLLKFDAGLTLQWFKKLGSDDDDYSSVGGGLIQTADGGFLVGGNLKNEVATAIKTNAMGEVIWSKQYFDNPDEQDGFKTIIDIAPTKDGNYLLLTESYSNSDSGEFDSTYLLKINGNGDVLWSKYITATSLGFLAPTSIITTTDGNFLVSAGSYDVSDIAQAILIKISQDGNVLLSVTSNNPTDHDSYLYKVIEDKDGGYIAAGELDTTDADFNRSEQSYFLKVSSSGNLLWTKVLSTSIADYEAALGLTPTSDGGFVATGYSDDDGTLYKFGSDYSICGNVSSFGSLSNLGASTVAKSVAELDLTTSATSTAPTVASAGSGINLCSSLPLQLLSFNATLQNKNVNIEWKTANEVNTSYFIVERSSNGTAFTALQKVIAKGNSSDVQTYITTDLQPMFGTSYYRLKQVDKDGNTTYSNIVPVTVSANGTIVISPNPVRDNIRVLLQSKESISLTFQVTDMSGRVLAMQSTKVNAGTNTVIMPATSLSKGLYLLKVTGNNTTQSIKFIKE